MAPAGRSVGPRPRAPGYIEEANDLLSATRAGLTGCRRSAADKSCRSMERQSIAIDGSGQDRWHHGKFRNPIAIRK
jgi:hypothetical protein